MTTLPIRCQTAHSHRASSASPRAITRTAPPALFFGRRGRRPLRYLRGRRAWSAAGASLKRGERSAARRTLVFTQRSVTRPWRRTLASRRSTAASSCREPLAPNTGVGPRFAGLGSSFFASLGASSPHRVVAPPERRKAERGLRQRAPRARLVVAGGRGPDAARVRGCVPGPRAPRPAPPSDASRRRPR
jgi:hypothetical protein